MCDTVPSPSSLDHPFSNWPSRKLRILRTLQSKTKINRECQWTKYCSDVGSFIRKGSHACLPHQMAENHGNIAPLSSFARLKMKGNKRAQLTFSSSSYRPRRNVTKQEKAKHVCWLFCSHSECPPWFFSITMDYLQGALGKRKLI